MPKNLTKPNQIIYIYIYVYVCVCVCMKWIWFKYPTMVYML